MRTTKTLQEQKRSRKEHPSAKGDPKPKGKGDLPPGRRRLTERRPGRERAVVRVGNVAIGGGELTVVVDIPPRLRKEQALQAAEVVARCGAQALAIGDGTAALAPTPASLDCANPRLKPGEREEESLPYLRKAAEARGLLVFAEVPDPASVDPLAEHADVLVVGARSMQDFLLLQAVGRCGKPVLLERGPAATVEEWLWAAEYVLAGGNDRVILCERGTRAVAGGPAPLSFDLTSIPTLKAQTHLPVLIAPGPAAGAAERVPPLARAGVAAGADGLRIGIQLDPEPEPPPGHGAGEPLLTPAQLRALVGQLGRVAEAVGRPRTREGRSK